jgi:hypothetical protein
VSVHPAPDTYDPTCHCNILFFIFIFSSFLLLLTFSEQDLSSCSWRAPTKSSTSSRRPRHWTPSPPATSRRPRRPPPPRSLPDARSSPWRWPSPATSRRPSASPGRRPKLLEPLSCRKHRQPTALSRDPVLRRRLPELQCRFPSSSAAVPSSSLAFSSCGAAFSSSGCL